MKYLSPNDIIFSPLMRSNEVGRYSGIRLSSPESLGQHITDMCMMSYIIAHQLKNFGEEVDLGVLLEKCLIHDIDEISTGDLPRNTKYALPEIKKSLDRVADMAVQRYSDSYNMPELLQKWREAKDGKEGFIVKVCDMLCCVRKAAIEVEVEGNMSALRVTKELVRHIRDMKENLNFEGTFDRERSVSFFRDLLEEAHRTISEINHKYWEVASKYKITMNIIEEMID